MTPEETRAALIEKHIQPAFAGKEQVFIMIENA
jgi:hypothetical protein